VTLFYLRHAEAGHNVKAEFVAKGIPTNEWPAYVGNENAFSPKGEAQALATATNLLPFQFDLIAVSPKWRTRHTILPYLKATGQQAEIWPELAETAKYELTNVPPDTPVADDLLAGRRTLHLPEEETPYFHLRADGTGTRLLVVTNAAEVLVCARRVEELLRSRYPEGPARVLLVGHGNASLMLLRHLARQPALQLPHQKNVHLWTGELHPDGTFALDRYNVLPQELAPAPSM
jgi:broad specificity phosphatase PhoE